MSSLRDRFTALPRAARWVVFAAGFCILYFAAVEPALEHTSRFNSRADAIAGALARERTLAASWSDSNTPAAAARAAFGAPAYPAPIESRSRALYNRVSKIFEAHRIVPDIIERRAPLRAEQAEALSPAQRIDRFILDLTFEASPEVAAEILAELEKSEEVAAVGRVDIRRVDLGRSGAGSAGAGSPRRVRAVFSPEAWVLVQGSRP